MIDFRYHLVSIVAIFLALAVGIVMGTTLLQSPAIESARRVSDEMTTANNGLRADIDAVRGKESYNDSVVTGLGPQLVAGELTGQHILLVEAPGSSTTYREAEEQLLTEAGASITGRISLTDKYVDPKLNGVIDGLATQLKPADLTFPAGATAYDKAAALLAAAFTTTDQSQVSTSNPATSAVLTGFEAGDLLSYDGEPDKRATLVVMFAPEKPFDGENAETQSAALVSLAAGLDTGSKGAVLAGAAASTGTGGAIDALRGDSDTAKHVSSVDTADLPTGRIVIVYALREQADGHAGQYGYGSGASAPQPAVPNSTPTPTQSGS